MDTKETVLRILEAAKAKCAQAVLDGSMTVKEYEEATGKDGADLRTQIMSSVQNDLGMACSAIREQLDASTQKAIDRLAAAGLEKEEAEALVLDISAKAGFRSEKNGLVLTSEVEA